MRWAGRGEVARDELVPGEAERHEARRGEAARAPRPAASGLRVEARARLGGLALDVALEVGVGECVALAGPSGAGKTSVLRTVAGLLAPERGFVACAGEVWLDTERGIALPAERRRCGYLFQEYALFGHLSAWRNVAYALHESPRPAREPRAKELLGRFGLADRAGARPATLSGGERQRVALARALARRPAALLLDEPLSALDARTRAAAARQLGAVIRNAAVPVLLVTHDFTEAARLADRIAVMDGGRVLQEGTASALAAAPASAFVADFSGAVVLMGDARRGEEGVTVVALDGGGELTALEGEPGPVAVSVYPWEIALARPGDAAHDSARNHLDVDVVSVTTVGPRVRVGLAAPQPLTAELSESSLRELELVPGGRAVASFKAAATRVLPR
jgi:molybdate transport system ATP-binding protein